MTDRYPSLATQVDPAKAADLRRQLHARLTAAGHEAALITTQPDELPEEEVLMSIDELTRSEPKQRSRRSRSIAVAAGVALAAAAVIAAALVLNDDDPSTDVPIDNPVPAVEPAGVEPTHEWTFDDRGAASVGRADLAFFGTYEVREGVLSLDGQTGYAETSAPVSLDTSRSFSLAAWVSVPVGSQSDDARSIVSPKGGDELLSFLGRDQGAWTFVLASADAPPHVECGCTQVLSPAEPVDPTAWLHVVGVYDVASGAMRLYVDGSLMATQQNTSPSQETGTLQVGGVSDDGYSNLFWAGSIASVAIYDSALTDEQVATLATQDRPSTPAPTALPSPSG